MNKKFLTKLLDSNFRAQQINAISRKKLYNYKIPQYARYVVDSCIINRSRKYADDKEYGYGFSPVQFLCTVKENGIDKKFFEFNSVNYFLRQTDGDAAVDVVQAILVKWTQEDKAILDFDIDKIDTELEKIEREYIEAEKTKEETNNEISSNVAESV